MPFRSIIMAVFLFLPGIAQNLRVGTVNCWSGLDYRGVVRMGEFESDSTREYRLRILIRELKEKKLDVIALQESNPVRAIASRIADELDYDFICQRSNGGLKLGTVGFPWNLNEGLVLLARKELKLRFVDVWDLSETFGIFGNVLSLHFQDQNIALVGAIEAEGAEIYLVNTHLSSAVPDDSLSRSKLFSLLKEGPISDRERERFFHHLQKRAEKRREEVETLISHLEELQAKHIVLLGDFNAKPESFEIRRLTNGHQFIDVAAGREGLETWNAERNTNIRYSLQSTAGDDLVEFGGPLEAWYDSLSRRIDYIFLGPTFSSRDVGDVRLMLDEPQEGIHASDHFGLMAEISVNARDGDGATEESTSRSALDFLPIVTYDTDVGFGYGGKGFLLNHLGHSESFDIVLFNSTKGERWYRFVFSVPDFELRQGTRYALSFDLVVDYDKYLKNNFFGLGNRAPAESREVYTKEPLEIQAVVSRGFSERFVGQLGVRFKTVRNFNEKLSGLFAGSLPSINHRRSTGWTFFSSLRYDSRDSFVNPSDGNVVQLDLEAGTTGLLSDYSLQSLSLSLQTYYVLFYPKTVFAARLFGQAVGGTNLPIHTYASLGGNRTLRGYPQDRFLDRVALVSNIELRFPIVWRFGGVLFIDAGRVSESIGQMRILSRGWKTNSGFGLRFLMDTFVVRADLGLSREGSGFYFNFGHIF